jgi:hypothetical protein
MSAERGSSDSDAILQQLEEDRSSGRLAESVTTSSWVRYGIDSENAVQAMDRLGRTWSVELEEWIRQYIQETPPLASIMASDLPEYSDQPEALEGILEWLLRDGTLRQRPDGQYYRAED